MLLGVYIYNDKKYDLRMSPQPLNRYPQTEKDSTWLPCHWKCCSEWLILVQLLQKNCIWAFQSWRREARWGWVQILTLALLSKPLTSLCHCFLLLKWGRWTCLLGFLGGWMEIIASSWHMGYAQRFVGFLIMCFIEAGLVLAACTPPSRPSFQASSS